MASNSNSVKFFNFHITLNVLEISKINTFLLKLRQTPLWISFQGFFIRKNNIKHRFFSWLFWQFSTAGKCVIQHSITSNIIHTIFVGDWFNSISEGGKFHLSLLFLLFSQFSIRGRSIFESGCMFVRKFFKIFYLLFRFELFWTTFFDVTFKTKLTKFYYINYKSGYSLIQRIMGIFAPWYENSI